MSSHKQILAQCRKLIPPLTNELHKGQAGRIGVIGGSADYSGAPFFASMSALRIGADLAHVICEPAAGNIIKTYSPGGFHASSERSGSQRALADLIVHTDLGPDSTEKSLTELYNALLPRLHVLVVGPGLGRSKHMQLAARVAIKLAREKDIYIVIDADGLWLAQNEPDVVKGYAKAVLTPNVVEFGRLCDAVDLKQDSDRDTLAARLADALGGVTVLQKGSVDRITNGQNTKALVNQVQGSVRRCGGQGDVLSGSVGTFLAWAMSWQDGQGQTREDAGQSHFADVPLTMLAAYAGSTLTRTASRITYARMKRAMQTSDMLDDVGHAFEEVFGEQDQEAGGQKSKV
ncbi:hypothetical protein OIV83_004431 [Microbotryomycetes sp. JL201]|nr:hypothetical protein OIV83_004431 [Microbotryomycetes sp. JL201]